MADLAMDLPEVKRMIASLGTRVSGRGWMPAWRSVEKVLRDHHKKTTRGHTDPGHTPWPKIGKGPDPKIGDVGPVAIGADGRPRMARISTGAQLKRVEQNARKLKWQMSPRGRKSKGAGWVKSIAGKQAIHRTGSQKPTKRILEFLSSSYQNPGNAFPRHPGIRVSRPVNNWRGLEYGFPRVMRFAAELDQGNSWNGYPVPARPLIGMTPEVVARVTEIIEKRYKVLMERALEKEAAAALRRL